MNKIKHAEMIAMEDKQGGLSMSLSSSPKDAMNIRPENSI